MPELATPLPGPPPEPKPAVIDQEELLLLSADGEPLVEVDPETTFHAIFRFHLVSPPEGAIPDVRLRIIAYVKGVPATAWSSIGAAIPEENNIYQYEGKLKSPPKTKRQYFVRVDFGDQQGLIEQPIVIR